MNTFEKNTEEIFDIASKPETPIVVKSETPVSQAGTVGDAMAMAIALG